MPKDTKTTTTATKKTATKTAKSTKSTKAAKDTQTAKEVKQTKATKKATTTNNNEPPKTIEDLFAELIKDDPQIVIKIEWKEVEPVYKRILSQIAKTLKVDGFRPGKVPASIAEDRVRRDYLIGEVSKQLMPGRLDKAIKDSKDQPDAEPNVLVTAADKGKDWSFTVLLPQRTVIKLPEYKKFLTDKKKEVRKNIEAAQKQAAEDATKNKQKAPPALDDAQIKARATDEALVALMQQIRPQVSRTLVQRGAQQEYENLVNQLGQYQITWDDYLKNSGVTEDVLWQQFMLRALENIQMEFMLDALMAAEKVTATDEELIAKMKEVMPEVVSEEDQQRQLAEPSVYDYLELITKRQKLATWLLDL